MNKSLIKMKSLIKVKFDKISSLKPAFDKNGTVTAANASTINDGAAGLLLAHSSLLDDLDCNPKAKIIAQASSANKPEWFTTAPVKAIKNVLDKAKLSIDDIDLFEINEAFSVVAMAALKRIKNRKKQAQCLRRCCILGASYWSIRC